MSFAPKSKEKTMGNKKSVQEIICSMNFIKTLF